MTAGSVGIYNTVHNFKFLSVVGFMTTIVVIYVVLFRGI
jgi:hypothetical protein